MDEQQFREEEETELSKQKEPWEDDGKKRSVSADLFDWAEALVYALAVLVVICAFFVRLSGVVGSSMYPTLHEGDQLLISSFGYDEPERGDIVVLMADGFMDEPLVKRVIALGGDTVEIDGEEGVVYVNGEALYEPYINDLAGQDMYTGDLTGAFTVPEGEVFVMGDNRNGSSDSRKLYEVGTIPYEKIVGKAIFRIFPFSRVGSLS